MSSHVVQQYTEILKNIIIIPKLEQYPLISKVAQDKIIFNKLLLLGKKSLPDDNLSKTSAFSQLPHWLETSK